MATKTKDPVVKKGSWVVKDRTYVLKGNRTPITFTLASKHHSRNPLMWFDEEQGLNRELRYASNQNSPFRDEQKGFSTLKHIVFRNGSLFVPKADQALQKLLSLYHPQKNLTYYEADSVAEAKDDLQDLISWVTNTSEGRTVYEEFLNTHRSEYPSYVEELIGMSEGANVSFVDVFCNNLILEMTSLKNPPGHIGGVDDCSDYSMCTNEFCGVAHNEDDASPSLNKTAMIAATFGTDGHRFVGFTYLGDLTSGAFGFNSYGIAFTLNWVGPTNVLRGGIGRGFVSRSMLDARSLDDAIARATVKNQCAGHNYQIMDVVNRRVVNIETAPGWTFGIQEIVQPYFHANQYELLKVSEHFDNSSVHRIRRVHEMSVPRNASALLNVLGDQHDEQYPIFHDELSHARGELSDWTMATALFDLDTKTMNMYHGNPKNGSIMYQYDLLSTIINA